MRRRVASLTAVATAAAGTVLLVTAVTSRPGAPPPPPAPHTAAATLTPTDEHPDNPPPHAAHNPPPHAAPAAASAPAITATVGQMTFTGDGALITAGATEAAADTATLTAVCPDGPCPAHTTIWRVGSRRHDGNPITVQAAHPALLPVTVTVTGRPTARPFTLTAAARAADWPHDGWVSGQTQPDRAIAALALADTAGWLPRCSPSPGGQRQLCPGPPSLGGERVGGNSVEDDTSAGICAQTPTDGCVTAAELATAAAAAAGRPVDGTCADCHDQPATVAATYAAAADIATAPPAPSGCPPNLRGCVPAAAAALTAGAPTGPSNSELTRPATRADVALLLTWAAGHHWVTLPPPPAPAGGTAGQTVTVTYTAEPPGGWPTPTLRWPDPPGAQRLCDPTVTITRNTTLTCNYRLIEPGAHISDATLTSPAGHQRTIPITLLTDPAPPTLAVSSPQRVADQTVELTVTTSTPVDRWLLHSPGDRPSRRHTRPGWHAHLTTTSPTAATVRIHGQPDTDLSAEACAHTSCASIPLPTSPNPTADHDNDTTVSNPQRVSTVAATGPVTVDLPIAGWQLHSTDPHLTVYARDNGQITIPPPGQTLTSGHLRVHTPDWWNADLGHATITLRRGTDTWTIVVHHPAHTPDR